jgi:hypothetical protein
VFATPKSIAASHVIPLDPAIESVASKSTTHAIPPAGIDHRHHRPKTTPNTIIVGITVKRLCEFHLQRKQPVAQRGATVSLEVAMPTTRPTVVFPAESEAIQLRH